MAAKYLHERLSRGLVRLGLLTAWLWVGLLVGCRDETPSEPPTPGGPSWTLDVEPAKQ